MSLSKNPYKWNRRRFLEVSALAAAGTGLGAAKRKLQILVDPADPVASSAPGSWAADELQHALEHRGITVERHATNSKAGAADFCILFAGPQSGLARDALKQSGAAVPETVEALTLAPAKLSGRSAVVGCGYDPRAVVYAALELAEIAVHSSDPLAALAALKPVTERPANQVRSITRLFTSDIEDKPWYNDREMWGPYLTMLASQRFNRFSLSLGIGYDFLRGVTDAYFLFAYPFLLDVPGYRVRVPQLSDDERDRNLEMLRYISEQTVARGMQFQLGIWMHGYQWIDSPNPNYTIEGLTAETHGPYCRDAVRTLLKACPAISGVTFRIHGESGVQEGSFNFWKSVFEGVATCGRTVEIDMHSKGMDQNMLDVGVQSGMPLKVSPKYWAEHFGMPYHQADIRELERPRADTHASGLMKLSAGSRSFLRYGYGDLLREDRKWDVMFRIWPGTQRLLLWGDPETARQHSREFSFCGSVGVEIMEPLSFKGRRGSGIKGGRCAYADSTLKPRWDWEKYLYNYRVWGRMLYNPDSDPDVYRRYLRAEFGAGGPAMESALGNASRILPIVTTAHDLAAANNIYWPELYLNQSLFDTDHPGQYTDTAVPRVFGNVSPLDPQLFYSIDEFADDLLKGELSGKYSPIEVAQWIEDYAAQAEKSAQDADRQSSGRGRPEYRRAAIDIALMAGMGRFFGAKFRAGVLYRVFEKTGDKAALERCIERYRAARDAFADVAARAKGVYVPAITFGEHPQLRGHWLDRLPGIDADIAAISKRIAGAATTGAPGVTQAIVVATGRPRRMPARCTHVPPQSFRQGEAVDIALTTEGNPESIRMYYRHVDQAERWESVPMDRRAGRWAAAIPARYTNSEYPLQYYFQVRQGAQAVALYPGLGPKLIQQPYFVLRASRS